MTAKKMKPETFEKFKKLAGIMDQIEELIGGGEVVISGRPVKVKIAGGDDETEVQKDNKLKSKRGDKTKRILALTAEGKGAHEIADIVGCSLASVHMARYNAKKKGLKPDGFKPFNNEE